MKTIGLIGGTGWASSVEYYRLLNEGVNKKLGGLNYARCILYSLNYADVDALNQKKDYNRILRLILDTTKKLQVAGADGIVLCANTLHMFADQLQVEIDVPIVHIGEATAIQIKEGGFNTVSLLGTKLTMGLDFYKEKLRQHGIETLIPKESDQNFIQQTIINELFNHDFKVESRECFLRIIHELQQQGSQAAILACTEIPLLVKQQHTSIPLFDTLKIHANAIVDFITGQD